MAQEERQPRPYLDPKPGEQLPDKKVSSKAYGRLSVAADAIAATEKAIQHQGNQVPSLKATNMKSYYRLRVMRDSRCWEYTTREAQHLAYANREADIAAKADLAHAGNCGEHAWVAYHYLRLNAAGERIQVSQKSGLDQRSSSSATSRRTPITSSRSRIPGPTIRQPASGRITSRFASART